MSYDSDSSSEGGSVSPYMSRYNELLDKYHQYSSNVPYHPIENIHSEAKFITFGGFEFLTTAYDMSFQTQKYLRIAEYCPVNILNDQEYLHFRLHLQVLLQETRKHIEKHDSHSFEKDSVQSSFNYIPTIIQHLIEPSNFMLNEEFPSSKLNLIWYPTKIRVKVNKRNKLKQKHKSINIANYVANKVVVFDRYRADSDPEANFYSEFPLFHSKSHSEIVCKLPASSAPSTPSTFTNAKVFHAICKDEIDGLNTVKHRFLKTSIEKIFGKMFAMFEWILNIQIRKARFFYVSIALQRYTFNISELQSQESCLYESVKNIDLLKREGLKGNERIACIGLYFFDIEFNDYLNAELQIELAKDNYSRFVAERVSIVNNGSSIVFSNYDVGYRYRLKKYGSSSSILKNNHSKQSSETINNSIVDCEQKKSNDNAMSIDVNLKALDDIIERKQNVNDVGFSVLKFSVFKRYTADEKHVRNLAFKTEYLIEFWWRMFGLNYVRNVTKLIIKYLQVPWNEFSEQREQRLKETLFTVNRRT